jgi:hypothetical protein
VSTPRDSGVPTVVPKTCPAGTEEAADGGCEVPPPACNDPSKITCGCDLSGTFLVHTVTQLHWDQVPVVGQTGIAAGKATLQSWGAWTFKQAGNLVHASARGCGGEVPEICSPLLHEAYAQGLPDSVWESPAIPAEAWELMLDTSGPVPKLAGGPHASFFGMRLKDGLDPLGPFPNAHTDPNIVWTDDDGDMAPGTTSVVRPPGGTSTVCNYPFAFVPVEQVLGGARASKIRGGARAIQTIAMTLDSCDLLHGTLTALASDGRAQGCVLSTGAECTPAEVNFIDSQPQTQHIDSASFVLTRVPSLPTSCAAVRAATFPP